MEPADRLVDTAVSQYEENRLAYIELCQSASARNKRSWLTRSEIQLTSAGRPVDLVFEDAMNHPDVLHLLQPLPSTSPALKRTSEPKNDDPRKLPKGKSKGKGKSIRMPQEWVSQYRQ